MKERRAPFEDTGRAGGHLVQGAAQLTVGLMLRNQARNRPEVIAVDDGTRRLSYAAFNARVNRLANVLSTAGVVRGDRVAVCAENCIEYLELAFACAKLGSVLCTLNWRLAEGELGYCVQLVEPKLIFASQRFAESPPLRTSGRELVTLGSDYESRLAAANADEPDIAAEPEDGLLIIYTSGTTGHPKAAMLSHRAEIARMLVNSLEMSLVPGDAFVAWPPMFHMISTEQCIHVLCLGGTAVVVNGFDLERILAEIESREQWWLVLMPGMIDQVISAVRERSIRPKGIRLIGVMADLVPRHRIAEITTLLQAPYANTFGSTETGLPPASAGRIKIGTVPDSLSKRASALCDFRLVDADDNPVPDGAPGELAFRGPTLFSGYWNASGVNATEFRNGWFHMGDMFVRNPDGSLDFVDRAKYLIKSGGENIYPAEVERVLLSDPKVQDAVVVRRRDDHWGEVPVALVARKDTSLTAAELIERCRRELAGYKRPRELYFIEEHQFPRSTTGKILRHEIEKWPMIASTPQAAANGP